MGWNTNPFLIMTLREFYFYLVKSIKKNPTNEITTYYSELINSYNASSDPWVSFFGDGGFRVFNRIDGNRDYDTFMVKLFPPKGWLCLGDIFFSVPSKGQMVGKNYSTAHSNLQLPDDVYALTGLKNNPFWGPSELFDLKIVFVKDNPKYAIKCDIDSKGLLVNDASTRSMCDVSKQIDGTVGYSESGFFSQLYKLGCTNPNYIAPGSRWYSRVSSNLNFYGAVNRSYIEQVSYKIPKSKDVWYYNGGAKIAGGDGTKGGCDYNAWSVVAYYDRDNSKNGNVLNETDSSEVNDGKLTYTNVFNTTSSGWDWRDEDSAEGPSQVLYVVHFEDTNRLCCIGQGNFGAAECGLGLNKIQQGSAYCADMFRQDCTSTSPYMTKNYCLKYGCRNNPKSENPIACDYELKNFCGDNVNNLLKYPDMCSCFMSTKVLKPQCDSMADLMNIRNNKPAKKVLNIDTDDPLQCTQNALVNPVCRMQTIPSDPLYPLDRQSKYVQHGYIQDKSDTGDRTVCVQTATINNQGKIGSLTIDQNASCGEYKSKFCQNSTLSKCIYEISDGEFVKQVVGDDKDGGMCKNSVDSLKCASIDYKTPLFDSGCKNGTRTFTYKALNIKNKQDAIDAITSILPTEMKDNLSSIIYTEGAVSVIIKCADCELGFESIGQCYLDGNVWKTKAKKTKVIQRGYNGGKECVIDNSEQVTDCLLDADCAVDVKTQDSGCVKDGNSKSRKIEFNITSNTSGNGKGCDDVINSLLPQLYKDNAVTIKYSDDRKTATASIECRDCVVDYKVDVNTNGGECYFSEDKNKNVIMKIPYLKKQPFNGGECDSNLLKKIKDKKGIEMDCPFNQDCQFEEEPSKDACVNGVRKLEFNIKNPPNGNGMKCEDAAKTFGVKYTKDTNQNKFLNDVLYLSTKCEKAEDCVIDDESYQSACDSSTGEGIELYKVLSSQKTGGKTCLEVAKEKFPNSTSIKESGSSIAIGKTCKKVDNKKIIMIASGIAIMLLIIIVLYFVI